MTDDQLPADQQPLDLETSAINSHSVDFYRDDPERRPRVIHLLIWLGIVAAYFGLLHASRLNLQTLTSSVEAVFGLMFTIAKTLGAGAGLFGFVLLLERRLNKIEFPTQLGEYLLLAVGGQYLIIFISQLVFGSERFFAYRDLLTRFARVPLIAASLVAIVILVCAWGRASSLWRVFIVAFAIAHVPGALRGFLHLTADSRILLSLFYFTENTPMVVLAIIAWREWREKKRLPWTHWLGVAAQLWIYLSVETVSAIYTGYYYLQHFGLI